MVGAAARDDASAAATAAVAMVLHGASTPAKIMATPSPRCTREHQNNHSLVSRSLMLKLLMITIPDGTLLHPQSLNDVLLGV